MNRKEWEFHTLKDCTERLIEYLNKLRINEIAETETTLSHREILCIMDNLIALDMDINEKIIRNQ